MKEKDFSFRKIIAILSLTSYCAYNISQLNTLIRSMKFFNFLSLSLLGRFKNTEFNFVSKGKGGKKCEVESSNSSIVNDKIIWKFYLSHSRESLELKTIGNSLRMG